MKQSDIFAILDVARRARKLNKTFNPLFSGAPGIGKSEIVAQWAKQNNLPVLDIRAAYLEAPDMIGFPQPTVVNGRQVTVHYTPDIWPDAETQPEGVLLLDEVNRANQSMMNTLMQLLTDRKIHKYELPKGWIICACVNPENSANDVNSMDTAFRDRFEIFDIEYDKKIFVNYMTESNWDSRVVQFIESGAWTYRLPEDIGNTEGAKYLSPRGFSKLNAALQAGVPKDLEYEMYTSMLGKLTGKAFYAFVTNEAPVTYSDLTSKDKKKHLSKLKVYSDPENYKSGLISITVKSIIENADNVTNELLYEVSMVMPADQSLYMIEEVGHKLKKEDILNDLCNEHKDLLTHFKEILKKQKGA